MKIDFKKIPTSGVSFEVFNEDIKFYGIVKKIENNLVKGTGVIEGSFMHQCDRCGIEFVKNLKETVEIFASNGIYKEDNNLLNLIEFFDGFVNFDIILQSEIESYKCDYLYCNNCK